MRGIDGMSADEPGTGDSELERLRAGNARLAGELREAREQQDATVGVLRVIATSPDDLQVILDTIARQASELCGADVVLVQRSDGEFLRALARHVRPEMVATYERAMQRRPAD